MSPSMRACSGGGDKPHVLITHGLRAEGHDASEDGTGRGTPLVVIAQNGSDIQVGDGQTVGTVSASQARQTSGDVLAFGWNKSASQTLRCSSDTCDALQGSPQSNPAIAFAENSRAELRLENGDGQRTGSLSTGGGKMGQGVPAVVSHMKARRLTPTECERLMGLPDGWTCVCDATPCKCPDSPRYRAIGNGVVIPVVGQIAERLVRAMATEKAA